ncbi:probable tRNA N6-adenosine threonylcarbamoyltransferase, mitochondrial [Xiphophorus maculatus]|uniref:probable tRNA N6-adenosine threonylcarbamoyltransferase, mitochondrial n=1 Tax=Xiphophorus maculatus TaxID=8083 RepID=UPI000C6D53A9|nr:probable tRNA N6-adenosine threonylcarbamoyltransferase, mitochondrial [Xiphophorus maculatus]
MSDVFAKCLYLVFVFGNEHLSKYENTVRALTRPGQIRCRGSVAVVLNRPSAVFPTGVAPPVGKTGNGRAALSGGQAIELLAQDGDRKRFRFRTPMGQTPDCCFSFAGLRNQVTLLIQKQEVEEGVEEGTVLSCVNDIDAATQHTVASHLAKRTHRAVLFCRANRLLPSQNPMVVRNRPLDPIVSISSHSVQLAANQSIKIIKSF